MKKIKVYTLTISSPNKKEIEDIAKDIDSGFIHVLRTKIKEHEIQEK